MSALFDIIIGFITALVSAAFLHFGAGGAPEQPKAAPVTQTQPASTVEPKVATEVVSAEKATTEPVVLKAEISRADSSTRTEAKRPQTWVHVAVDTDLNAPKAPVAPIDMLAAPPAPPSPPALPALTLRIAGLSADEHRRIAAEVESELRAAELEIALEIAAQQDEIRSAAAMAARMAQHQVAVNISVSDASGPCPDAEGAPLPSHIRTFVAQ